MSDYAHSLCWFRRDLRLDDHAALYHALAMSRAVHCAFVFDTDILDALPSRHDRRVAFIWQAVRELKERLEALGGTLHVLHGRARLLIPQLAHQLGVEAVFCNHDYEPAAKARDAAVAASLQQLGIAFHHYKDQVIFEGNEVLNSNGQPYAVFTPYRNAWRKKLASTGVASYDCSALRTALAQQAPQPLPEPGQLGFHPAGLRLPCGSSGAEALLADFLKRMDHYHETRDFPALKGVSYLSAHLRFGTVSIRLLVQLALQQGSRGAETWLDELIWREFYQMLLFHHPRLAAGASFKPQFDALQWENDAARFAAWREGRTGYPLVDAAMRQLLQSGYMHNRLRMVTASFLVKDLAIDWRWGERHFAAWLLDYDFAANNGGWQWAASTGCDAQPWFRIFNPITQSQKFDPQGRFIRRYVPELARCPDRYLHAPWRMPPAEQEDRGMVIGRDYPAPIVDHAVARTETLARYQAVAPR